MLTNQGVTPQILKQLSHQLQMDQSIIPPLQRSCFITVPIHDICLIPPLTNFFFLLIILPWIDQAFPSIILQIMNGIETPVAWQ